MHLIFLRGTNYFPPSKKKILKKKREREGETELSDKATSLLCLDQLEAHMKAFSKFKMNIK